MKIFQVRLDFDLKTKPAWLDNFRKKYDEPYKYHITLKHHTIVNENSIPELKKEVKTIAKRFESLKITFDKYFFDKTDTGNLIMILAKPNMNLINFQKDLVKKLSKFGKTVKPYYQNFEKNFKPHITIARKLSSKRLEQAKKQLHSNILCKAEIKKVSLTISNKLETSETIKPRNT